MNRVAAMFILAVLLGLAGCATSSGGPPASATRLPDVRLAALRPGEDPVRLSGLRGPMVINLWAQWCGPCREEMPVLERFHRKHPEVGMLGVDWQDPLRDRARSFARELGISYPLVRDPDGVMSARFLPRLILLDDRGMVAWQDYVQIHSVSQLEGLLDRHLEGA